MATVTIDYYGFEGIGKNVTEAKRDAGKKIEALHNGSFAPQLFTLGNNSMLVWRDLYGWHDAWAVLNGKPREESFPGGSGYDTRQEAIHSAVYRLACDYPEMTEDHPIWEMIDYRIRHNRINDWKRNRAFQAAYKAAPEDCANRHQWACENQSRFMPA